MSRLPDMDFQDFVTNPNKSISPSVEPPIEVYVVYYLGRSGNWLFSLPTFYYENAEKDAAALDRPNIILTYHLSQQNKISQERKDELRAKVIPITQGQVRRIRKVRMPKL